MIVKKPIRRKGPNTRKSGTNQKQNVPSLNVTKTSDSKDQQGSRFDVLASEDMPAMQNHKEEHVTPQKFVTENQAPGLRRVANQPKLIKKDSAPAQKTQPRGKSNSQNKPTSLQTTKPTSHVDKQKEISYAHEGKKITAEEKLRAEQEILRAMSRTHKDMCAQYEAGKSVDMLAMHAYVHAGASCSDMDVTREVDEPKPPDPTNSSSTMEVDSRVENGVVSAMMQNSGNGGYPHREV